MLLWDSSYTWDVGYNWDTGSVVINPSFYSQRTPGFTEYVLGNTNV